MAKGKGKGNNRARSNYFIQQIQKNGENFLAQKTPRDLANDSERVFRDFVRGNVDIEQFGSYIINPAFLEIMVTKAAEKLNYWWAIRLTMDSYIRNLSVPNNNIQVDESTMQVLTGTANDVIGKYTAYENLYNCLCAIKETGNPAPLENLPRVLGNYKFSI